MNYKGLVTAVFFSLVTFQSYSARCETIDYQNDIYPILEMYCVGCHTADDPQGGLVMESFDELMKGGASGLAVTAGGPNSSRLLLMASGKMEPVMPPDDAEGPDDRELAIIAKWIEQGAKGPDGDMPIKRTLRTPEIIADADTKPPVTAITASRDGGLTAYAHFGSISIEGSETGATVNIDDPDLGKVNSLAFSRDSSRLLAASGLTGAYGRASVYDTATGDLIREWLGHRDTIYAAEFSPDESMIATAGYDRTIVLWDAENGNKLRELRGHNGAIFDIAFSPDGAVLVSACADETVKVWNVATGDRLNTLGQPEGAVFAVEITDDGKFVVAGSGDNRLRVWRLTTTESAGINPLVATRFLDETPIVNFDLSPDGQVLVAISAGGNVKVVRTSDWQPVTSLKPLGESGTDLFIAPDNRTVRIALMNGTWVDRKLSEIKPDTSGNSDDWVDPVWMDLGEPKSTTELDLIATIKANSAGTPDPKVVAPTALDVKRNVVIRGSIESSDEVDRYRWRAGQGEVWAIDADATSGSRIDPIVTIFDAADQPVIRTRLQAVRDSYFTFRGKNSDQIGDFRIFNWQEMKLSEYLYAAGEVTRLQLHPRGPDSGFDVYPGEGKRWTYFGTSGTTHALGEPAYIVRPLPPGSQPLANGLPVFDVAYENDDDPMRMAGKNSRLLFTAPADGLYTVQVSDTRGEGGSAYQYELRIRPARPAFRPSVQKISKPLMPGIGREFRVRVERIDEYDGPVTFHVSGLPDRLTSNFPVTIEAGQRFATGMIWADANESGWKEPFEPQVTASAMINGVRVHRDAGSLGRIEWDDSTPSVVPMIRPIGIPVGDYENWTLQVRRGQTVSARVSVQRREGFNKEVSFGKERSGKNASQGVYVDNIGLNGLLIVAGADDREFFVTADETAVVGKRSFFLTANADGGVTSHPITVEVLP